MKIGLITDTHFGARNDSLIFSDFFRKFYENVFFPTLKERGITDVIHLGDVVDRRKFINYKTLNVMTMKKKQKNSSKRHELRLHSAIFS